VAALAAREHRIVTLVDIDGAFLNADMRSTGILVHLRLDRTMTAMLLEIDSSYTEFVALDKALYGCVEVSMLWCGELCSKLMKFGFIQNPYDPCSLNMIAASGRQITVTVHVDDLMITSVNQKDIDAFVEYLRVTHKELKISTGSVINYIEMTFEFREEGQVRVTMENCVNDILSGFGVETALATPAVSSLFRTRSSGFIPMLPTCRCVPIDPRAVL
jgi:hypothetical protein